MIKRERTEMEEKGGRKGNRKWSMKWYKDIIIDTKKGKIGNSKNVKLY